MAWLRQRLGNPADPMQQIGQVFGNVIFAWGPDLEQQGVGMPEQHAVIVGADFDRWAAAMQNHPWGRAN